VHRIRLLKPDGRELFLYARAPFEAEGEAPVPGPPVHAVPHLRWHPLREEWVAYAAHRQERTFMPPRGYDPLAPPSPAALSTEVPAGAWEIAVFENRFPTFTRTASASPVLSVPTRPARGACEVVVFTQSPEGSLGALPLDRIELLFDVWADRTAELGARDEVAYVYPFENRGAEMGVTLPHPHGQIYAYPFVPPLPARELEAQATFYGREGRGLLESILEEELRAGLRVVVDAGEAAAFVPVFARYSYEAWVAPKRAAPSLASLTAQERRAMARALKTLLLKYDALWSRPFPYVLAFHQAPTDGAEHPECHVHAEIYPAYRTRDRLKFLAGSELGAGVFTADSVPEEKAEELRRIEVHVE
jgi:UDPglucose--hexose-1-phosphate uridylyltransferase